MSQRDPQSIKPFIIIVIVAGALGALFVMVGDIGPGSSKLFATCLSLIFFGITGTICMVAGEKPEYKALGTAGMIVSGLGFLISVLIILGAITDEGILKLTFVLLILSIALAHICLLHHFTLQNKYALYARITATTAIGIFSLLLITRVFEPFAGLYSLAYNQSTLKLLVASLIVDLSATLLVPLCNRLGTDELPVELNFTEELPEVQEEQTPAP